MFGKLKFALSYWHTNAHLRPNVYFNKVGGLRLLHSTVYAKVYKTLSFMRLLFFDFFFFK